MAESLGLGKVDVANRQVISGWQIGRQRTGQLADDPFPISLCGFVLGHPEALGESDLDLIFVRAPFGFARRAAHNEFSRRTPAEFDADDLAFGSGLGAV